MSTLKKNALRLGKPASTSKQRTNSAKRIPAAVITQITRFGKKYQDHLESRLAELSDAPSEVRPSNYRKRAFDHYQQLGQIACAHCGFGIRDVLEIAHLDCNRSNNDMENLAILCPNCHKMHDLDMISTDTIRTMRDRPKVAVWAKRMKDAGKKAADTRLSNNQKKQRQVAAAKAVITRRKNVVASRSSDR